MSERMVVALQQVSNLSAISWREQVSFRWDDDDARFVLYQHVQFDFYRASSLKQVDTCCSTLTHYPDFEYTSLYSYSWMLHAQRTSSKYHCYSLWFHLTRSKTHDLPHSRWACQRCLPYPRTISSTGPFYK
jgi:hypothetical protein